MPVRIKKTVISRLLTARDAIQDALRLGSPIARFDPIILSHAARMRLAAIEDDLERIIRALQEEQ